MNTENLTPTDLPNGEEKQRKWAIAAHLLGLTYWVGIPAFIGPLVIYLIVDSDAHTAKHHARESLNFQINLLIWVAISAILTAVLIGFLGFAIAAVLSLIFPIIGSLQASDRKKYVYPLTYRFLK